MDKEKIEGKMEKNDKNDWTKALEKLLYDYRYESSMGLGKRGLQKHHVDALMQDLILFIEKEKVESWKQGNLDTLRKIDKHY